MCLPNSAPTEDELVPLYDEDGSLHTDESFNPTIIIPEGMHEHVDSVYLNFDLDDGILGFVYESGYEVIVIYTSPEAEELWTLVLGCCLSEIEHI